MKFSHFIATTSLDGSVKIWDYKKDNFVPIYEHASKKWVHSLYFDASINALFFNQEGKNFPQKILYFQDPDKPCESEKMVLRQYKLFNETMLKTSSHVFNDFAYVCGTNGIIYKLAKIHACRLIHKHKEKDKGSLAKKLI